MDDGLECGNELYSHHGVLIKCHTPFIKNVEYLETLGTLSIVEYVAGEKFIEWRFTEVAVESDVQDQGWAVVHEVKRHRTTSESTNHLRPIIQLALKDLKSFKISKSRQQLSVMMKDGTTHSVFYFQNANADSFVGFLKGIIKTSICKKDRNLYLVLDDAEIQNLSQSFAELELFTDDSNYWNIMKNSPYETTMHAFSKLTDAFLYKPQQCESGEVRDLLYESLHESDLPETSNRQTNNEEYEVITQHSTLPPRTTPMRTPPLNSEQWANFFDEHGRITEYEIVKEIIFHGGVERSLRSDVWKYLLGYYSWTSTHAEREQRRRKKEDEYFLMKLQWKSMTPGQEDRFTDYKERKSLIEKDVNRTDRTLPFYAGDHNPNLQTLQDILMTYVMYNFDLGYVQGMNDLLSPILRLVNDEVDAFWCFVGFMDIVSHNFDLDQAGMKQQLQELFTLLKAAEPELASYLEHHESSNMFFCFRWLLVWFKREFSYENTMLLWEVLWSQTCCKNFHLIVCVAILDKEKDTLMSNNYGFTEILKHINELSEKMDVDSILSRAEGIYLQFFTATKLPDTVRQIMGLDPLPDEMNVESEMITTETNDLVEQSTATIQNGGSIYGINFNADSGEVNFERSMINNF